MDDAAARRAFTFWALQLVIAAAYFWAQASGEAIFASVPWRKAETMWGIVTLAHLVLTSTIRALAKRHKWLALPPRPLFWRVFAATLLAAALTFGLTLAISQHIYGQIVPPILATFYAKLSLNNQLFNSFIGILLIYAAWVCGYFAIVIQRQRTRDELRRVQLSEALQAAELRLLKSQLNPHFLFNALNGVRALIADEPTKAQDAITQLARTLRYTLAAGDAELVTLAREMEMVDDYLALESLRLAERLRVVREIEPAAAEARIPVMLLQMLVENAIKHGIAPLRQGGTLRIAARVVARMLLIQVQNPCAPTQEAPPRAQGVGLKNASERLRLLFGDAASLELDLATPERAAATVRLPL
ncbi:MAG TPA: histidine kinase [Steroidobacteraceae bacterium]|nr:histidine kinase [Steroidobacteraceae bacterium]